MSLPLFGSPNQFKLCPLWIVSSIVCHLEVVPLQFNSSSNLFIRTIPIKRQDPIHFIETEEWFNPQSKSIPGWGWPTKLIVHVSLSGIPLVNKDPS